MNMGQRDYGTGDAQVQLVTSGYTGGTFDPTVGYCDNETLYKLYSQSSDLSKLSL